MNYALEIREHNVGAHLVIEKEIERIKSGLLTFTLRVNNGNIVDCSIKEYVNVRKKYGIIKAVIVEKLRITLNSGE